MNRNIIGICLIIISLVFVTRTYSQVVSTQRNGYNDSLDINYVVSAVLKTYPSIQKAKEAIQTAEENIDLSRTSYKPNINLDASYSRIGPVPAFNIAPYGEIKLYPNDNYNANLNISQSIYDFGKTASHTALAEEGKKLAETGFNMARQTLALNTIDVFYSLVYLQNAIAIRNEQVKNLNELVNYTRKKLNTGSSTNYELLNTQVRLSSTESNITDLKSMITSRLSVLSSLLDSALTDSTLFSQQFASSSYSDNQQELVNKALGQREEIHAAMEKVETAQLKYKAAKTISNPSLGAYAMAGEKNGYVPEINKIRFNYAAGISLNIPLYDAGREKANTSIAQSDAQSAEYDLDMVKRKVTNEVIEDYSNLEAAKDKISQFEMQVQLSSKAYDLAKVNYQAGAITDLDLLTAETNLSESKLLLLKSRIDYVLAVYKLKVSTGEKLYQ